jgi:hypothetical protein
MRKSKENFEIYGKAIHFFILCAIKTYERVIKVQDLDPPESQLLLS